MSCEDPSIFDGAQPAGSPVPDYPILSCASAVAAASAAVDATGATSIEFGYGGWCEPGAHCAATLPWEGHVILHVAGRDDLWVDVESDRAGKVTVTGQRAVPAASAMPGPISSGSPAVAGEDELRLDRDVIDRYYHEHPEARDQYGGSYFQHGDPWTLVVNVTDDPPVRPYPWEQDIQHPDQLEVRSVAYSWPYLRSIQRGLEPAIRNHKPWADGICAWAARPQDDAVWVLVEGGKAPKGFWARYDGIWPRTAFVFEDGCPIQLDAGG
ncbi:MAG: hypothetical protein U0869_10515 [Chloroflexota bacterium]